MGKVLARGVQAVMLESGGMFLLDPKVRFIVLGGEIYLAGDKDDKLIMDIHADEVKLVCGSCEVNISQVVVREDGKEHPVSVNMASMLSRVVRGIREDVVSTVYTGGAD